MSSPETDGGTVQSLEALPGFTVLRLELTSWVMVFPLPSAGAGAAPRQPVSAADLLAIEQ